VTIVYSVAAVVLFDFVAANAEVHAFVRNFTPVAAGLRLTCHDPVILSTDAHSAFSDGQANASNTFQQMFGMALFLIVFKGLKFTHNIPVMNVAGKTFNRAVVPTAMFGLVSLLTIMFAFALLFNSVFASSLPQYATTQDSLMTVVLDGLMGAIDANELDKASLRHLSLHCVVYRLYHHHRHNFGRVQRCQVPATR